MWYFSQNLSIFKLPLEVSVSEDVFLKPQRVSPRRERGEGSSCSGSHRWCWNWQSQTCGATRAKCEGGGGVAAGGTRHHLWWPHTHPSTRSPMLSRWPRNVRQWYCWLVSISDVFWTHTSARVCWNTHGDAQKINKSVKTCVSHPLNYSNTPLGFCLRWIFKL